MLGTRREWLLAGGLGVGGLLLDDFLRMQSAQARPATTERSFGKAKNVILLYLLAAPATWKCAI